jgi:hypothetical protein
MAHKKKSSKHKASVKAIEPEAVPNPAMHKQSKRKGGSTKKMAAKKCV